MIKSNERLAALEAEPLGVEFRRLLDACGTASIREFGLHCQCLAVLARAG